MNVKLKIVAEKIVAHQSRKIRRLRNGEILIVIWLLEHLRVCLILLSRFPNQILSCGEVIPFLMMLRINLKFGMMSI
jgi:hypothetical protein